jgi:hypothetical protein
MSNVNIAIGYSDEVLKTLPDHFQRCAHRGRVKDGSRFFECGMRVGVSGCFRSSQIKGWLYHVLSRVTPCGYSLSDTRRAKANPDIAMFPNSLSKF